MSGFVVPFLVLDWVNESVLCDWSVLMPVLTRSQQAREETPERRALREKSDDFLRGSSRSGESTEMMDGQPDERHGCRDTSETRTDRDAGRRPILEKFWGDEGENLEGWLFGIAMVAAAENWGNERILNSAIIALRGRARTAARMATLRFQASGDAEIKTVPRHFARANQADRCITLLHYALRLTP